MSCATTWPRSRAPSARSLEDIRRIAIELRPEALDDLGLQSALAVLCERFGERFGLQIRQQLGQALPELSHEAELVVYRVAQEALTNVARHSGADVADLTLTPESGVLTLTVTDDGDGLPDGYEPGTGMRGMRERATLIGANLMIDQDPQAGGMPGAPRGADGERAGRDPDGERAMTPLKTRVLLADDHALVRRGLRLVLDAEPDLEVVAETGDGAEAVQRALEPEVDLAILDISMPRMTGLQAARELHRRRPELRILMLSMHQNERYLYEALKAGASGYVLKTVADRDLVEACRAAMRGEKFLYPGAMTPLISDLLHGARNDAAVREDPLTPRETEIVKLIAESYSTKEIAEALVISEKTVDRHRTNILEKLGMHDRVELTRYAIRHGLVEP